MNVMSALILLLILLVVTVFDRLFKWHNPLFSAVTWKNFFTKIIH